MRENNTVAVKSRRRTTAPEWKFGARDCRIYIGTGSCSDALNTSGRRAQRSRSTRSQHADRISVEQPVVLATDRDAQAIVFDGRGESRADLVGIARVRKRSREQIFQLIAQLVSSDPRRRKLRVGEQLLQLGK